MTCPRCQSENRDGVAACAVCGISLAAVEGSAAEDEAPVELVSIFAGSDARRFLSARTRLDIAGIAHLSRGEGLRELFGARLLDGGPDRIEGPVEILVRRQDAAEAARLLAALDMENDGEEDRGRAAP
jgi:hypothetical protein